MRKLRALWLRIKGLRHARREEEDFAAELEAHIAMHVDDGARSGVNREEARRRAMIQLGGAEQVRQSYRERMTLPSVESLLRDMRYALRTLGKHKIATGAALLSIGLGIGANVTIFAMFSRLVLRPLPVGDPQSLFAFSVMHDGDRCCDNFSYPVYTDLRDQTKTLSGVAGCYEILPASISGGGEPERVYGQAVTTNFFDVLQLPMVSGRGFVASEKDSQSIVLGAHLWRRQFRADPQIVGKSVVVSGRNFTVVGIATPAFRSVDQILNTEFWIPLGVAGRITPGLEQQSARDFHWLSVVGRARAGVAREQVRAELETISARMAQAHPDTDKGNRLIMRTAGTLPERDKEPVLLFVGALSVVVLLVLTIAGANVANLLFAQSVARQRELAVRLALGATRAHLRRQMLVESLLLGLGGGILGLSFSLWSTRLISSIQLPVPVPVDLSFGVDWRVSLFAFLLSGLSGLLLGIAPAWAASRPRLADALRGEDALARPGRRFSLRSVLVVAQVAMSLVLLSLTGLFLRSLQGAANISIGFRPQGLVILSVDPRLHGYSTERTIDFLSRLRERAAALPGVISAACTDYPPLSMGGRSDGVHLPGKPDDTTVAELYMATPGYLQTLGIPLLAGRDIGNEPAKGPRVAVINRILADRLFPGQNPIGQVIVGPSGNYQVIGVSGNTKSRTVGEEDRGVLFRSIAQSVGPDPSFLGYTLVVRTKGDPNALLNALRQETHALDPAMAIYNEGSMEDHVRAAYFLPRLAAGLFGIFGGMGLVLAAIGLYGVMSYAVSRRTREIGIRMAMGARRDTVEGLIVRQGMALALIALLLGWPGAWMLSKLASSFLYGIQPHDAFTFTIAPIFLAAIAFIACWLPARRAASINPVQALRAE